MDSNELRAFLLDQSRREITYKNGESIHALLKCQYDEQTDFIFHLDEYKSHSPLRVGQNADYAGFVSYKTMCFYDGNYDMRKLLGDVETTECIVKRMRDAVSSAVQRLVGNKPVPITADAEKIWDEEKDRSDHKQYYAKEEAKRWFFNRAPISVYYPQVSYKQASTNQIIRFINDPDAFTMEEANMYIVKHAAKINYRLWALGVTQKEYDALESTPGEHHLGRAIAEALPGDEKKVTVHLLKDNQHFEGKMKADALRRKDGGSYSDWSLDAPDRIRFTKMFGRSANICPKDVQNITYGRKTLYEQKCVESSSLAGSPSPNK